MGIAYSATSFVLAFNITAFTVSHERLVAMSNESTTPRTGKLMGAVFDKQNAVVVTPPPTIMIRSAGTGAMNRITPNQDGKYEIELPTGIYQISSDIPGFYPFRRALFQIHPDETTMINLVPSARYVVRGTTISTTCAIDKPAPRLRYDTFSAPQSSSELLNLVIQFSKKRIFNRTTQYQNAIMSYDQLTIYSHKLTFDRANASSQKFAQSDSCGRWQAAFSSQLCRGQFQSS